MTFHIGCTRRGVRRVSAAAALVFGLAGASLAAAQTAEKVVATVENEPILYSEYEARVEQALGQGAIDPADSAMVQQLRSQVLEEMIDQRVLAREAEAKSIKVTDEEVTTAVNDAIAGNREAFGTEEAFQAQLKREGITEEELRHRYSIEARREMLGSRLVQSEFHATAAVTPEEVKAYFDAHRSELPPREETVHLQRIAIRVQPDSVVLAKAHALALDVRRQVLSKKMTFADAARRWSAAPDAKEGGDRGQVQRGDLAPEIGAAYEDSVLALPAGTISIPVRSPLGYEIFWVQEKDASGAGSHLSRILFDTPVSRADAVRAEETIGAIADSLRRGVAFDDLARRHSEAPEAAQGGELGEVPLSALQDSVRTVVQGLKIGQASAPIAVEGAFVIFRVMGQEAQRPYTFDEVSADLTEWLKQRKIADQYRQWVDGIKSRYFIERHV